LKIKNQKLIMGLWLLIGLGVLMLFIAAMQHKKNSLCVGSKVEISASNQTYFVNEKEIDEIINASGDIKERPIKSIDITALENALQKNVWIKNAELYFENNSLLHIDIEQRQPIARLFTVNGTSTYLDKDALRLPIKNTATARVLVITNFTSNNEVLAHTDSLLLMDIKQISNFIYADSFWNAQIAQVNITNTGKFELIPTVGNHIVKFGDANNLKEKFERLYTFYTKAWIQNGIDTYNLIDIRFNNQVVATKKGALNYNIDSIKNMIVVTDSASIDSLIH
jgi:cell division protein FtsQ